jgi:hypothetical protein
VAALPVAFAARYAIAGDDPPPAKAKVAAKVTLEAPVVTDDAALDDDILAVITLPLAADDAREAGVDPVEVEAAIDAVDAGGGSPGDASAVLTAEADATRKRGAKKGFGTWVRLQVASGKRGKELAKAIAAKKAVYAEVTDVEKAEADAKLAALKATWIEHRKKLHERRVELVKAGKKAKRRGEAELAALEKKLAKNGTRQKRVDEAIAADPKRKAELEALLAVLGKAEDKLDKAIDKAEDKLDKAIDKAEDKLDKAADKLDDAEDKLDKAKAKADAADNKADKAKDKADEAKDKADKAKEKKDKKKDGPPGGSGPSKAEGG